MTAPVELILLSLIDCDRTAQQVAEQDNAGRNGRPSGRATMNLDSALPIMLQQRAGRYLCVDGAHRIAAARALNWTHIRGVLVP